MKTRLLAAALAVASWLPAIAADAPPLATIAALDVPAYMGTWHEILRYPNRFQRQCVGESSADYQLQPDAQVRVTNRCRRADGQMDEAVGLARQVGGPNSPKLEVRFAPAWLSFLPFVWGDYWVVEMAGDGQWVIVSEPTRTYLWVLARTPALDEATLTQVRARLAANGFDTSRLVSAAAR